MHLVPGILLLLRKRVSPGQSFKQLVKCLSQPNPLVWASKKSALATLQLYRMSPSETNEVPLIEEMEYIVPRLALVPGIGPVSTYNSQVRTHGMISQSFSQK